MGMSDNRSRPSYLSPYYMAVTPPVVGRRFPLSESDSVLAIWRTLSEESVDHGISGLLLQQLPFAGTHVIDGPPEFVLHSTAKLDLM